MGIGNQLGGGGGKRRNQRQTLEFRFRFRFRSPAGRSTFGVARRNRGGRESAPVRGTGRSGGGGRGRQCSVSDGATFCFHFWPRSSYQFVK